MATAIRPSQPAPEYALGYSEHEHRRLMAQGQFFAGLTEGLLRRAGLRPGMRVLDVGCGAGDVTLLVATLVGPTGSVLAIDRHAPSMELAQERVRAAGLEHVAFRTGELATLEVEREFDALVGRWVLMYLSDPAAALGRWLRFVRSGGLVIFQEAEMSMARSVPDIPLIRTCGEWVRETFRRAGFEPDMGSRLYRTFVEAGLAEPEMILEGRIVGGSGQPAFDLLADTIRSLLPLMERLGVASAAAVQVDTLAARLEDELRMRGGAFLWPPLIGAWARKQGERV